MFGVTVAGLLGVLVLGSAEPENLVVVIKLGDGEEGLIESPDYPNDAPANLKHTWKIETRPGSVIELKCQDFRLYKSDPCKDYYLEIADGSNTQLKCGTIRDFSHVSSGQRLDLTLGTGQWGRGFVKCTARAVKSTPETGPKPNSHYSWRDWPSEEIDSSEHGQGDGRRNTSCQCGLANKQTQRIFGGRETQVHEFPFMVGIAGRGRRYTFCGGTVITSLHVVTAKHCVARGHDYDLIVAEHDIRNSKDTTETYAVPVKDVIGHAGFHPKLFHNDIAILLLESKLNFNKFVSPVCLPTGPMNLERQYIKIIGWGRTPENPGGNPYLQKVDLRIIPKASCHALRPDLIPPGSPTHHCVYGTGKSACTGDSGGPLVWHDPELRKYVLIGLVSYGIGPCGGTIPRVSTDVTAYVGWIQKVIRETNPEGITCSKV